MPIYINILCAVGIFLAKLAELSIQSIKLMFLVKGQRLQATLMAFAECLVWAFVVSGIITGLKSNLLWLFAYCFGYALGLFVGSLITEKLSLGFVGLQLVTNADDSEKIIEYLKANNFGYTKTIGEGSQSVSVTLNVVTKKKSLNSIMTNVKKITEGRTFSIIYDVNKVVGGIGLYK